LAVALFAVAAAQDPPPAKPAPPETTAELPAFDAMPLPSVEELLSDRRRDWVVLKDGKVIVVEPVYPRPKTLTKIQEERDAILADPKQKFTEEAKFKLRELTRLPVTLSGGEAGESPEYLIEIRLIDRIAHHEDLMLRKADELVEAGDLRPAFELLFVVARRYPNWAGLDERRTRIAEAETDKALRDGRGERAFALVTDLYEQRPTTEAAVRLLGRVADALIGPHVASGDFREARFFLRRVAELDAKHPAVATWTDRLTATARDRLAAARAASSAGDDPRAAALADEAALAWPGSEGLRAEHARLTARYPRLRVGVPRVAPESPAALPTAADLRTARLTHADLFELDRFETLPSYRSVYFERWEPTDLGRRARFRLRPGLPAWAARPPLAATDVVATLAARLRPDAAGYDARFADVVGALRVLGPEEFEILFDRIPLRTETALTRPPALAGGRAATRDETFLRFREDRRADGRTVYRRARPETGDGPRHLAELVEVPYPNYEEAARALDRGEVGMLAEVPAWDVPRLRADKRFHVVPLAPPATHLLQFHPSSRPLESGELRRALAAAVDRTDLLRIVAGEGGETAGRPVSALWPSTHPGYDPLVTPRTQDLPLALALTLAAKQAAGGRLPELVFVAPEESPAREAAASIAAAWKRIGLSVRLVGYEELKPGEPWDIAYRALPVADPAAELAPLLTLDPAARLEAFADLPDWLRQRLVDLERAGDPATANAALIDLHRLLDADVRAVPLIEADRFVVTRGPIAGLRDRPVDVYQQAERWVPPPLYPEDVR
jgi:tetratricopeptide (TPR) repeat protein